MKPARHNKNTLEGVFCINTPWSWSGFIWCLFADYEWLWLQAKLPPAAEGDEWGPLGPWYDDTVFCFVFQPDILSMAHVRCLTPFPALLFTSAMSLIMIISGSFTSIVNFFRYLFVGFLFASPVLLGFTLFISIFLQYLFEAGLLLSSQYWGKEEGRKKRASLGTSTFAMHECSCHYRLNWMWFILIEMYL